MADGATPASVPAPYAVSEAERDAVAAAISADELVDLALTLGNIPSPPGGELAAGDFVHNWMAREGFSPRKVGAVPERNNIIGSYGGHGPGKNLLFTAHLDTESPTGRPELDAHKYRPSTLQNREWRECWLEDGVLHGYPIANDRGAMAAFLIGAKALKAAGIDLSGRLYLTACPGEIGPEPIEEHAGLAYVGKDIGGHYLFHHGGVAPDYAVAAEGTDFGVTWVGCGYALFRLKLLGEAVFTPLLAHPEDPADHPNPIHRLGGLLEAVNGWCRTYEAENVYQSPGGTARPKAQIAAVRGGVPYAFGAGSEICNLYLEVGLTPAQKAADVLHALEALVAGLGEVEVEPMVVRNGFEADAHAVAPLVSAVDSAMRLARGHPAARAAPVYSSMWRDHNLFNMQHIPAITTGFKRWRPSPQDLVDGALLYALTALAVCGRGESTTGRARPRPVYGDNPFGG